MRVTSWKTGIAAAALTLVMAGPAVAQDCGEVPQPPALPAGETSSLDDLKISSRGVKNYIAGMDTYLDCLDGSRETTFELMNKDQRSRWNEDYDSLLTARNEIGERFNEEVSAYKKANKKD